jgi:hypothetical protein
MSNLTPYQFDYESTGQRQICERAATEIRKYERCAISDVIEMGKWLIEAKAVLSHGQWLPWIDSQLGWSHDKAQRCIRVARFSSHTPQIKDFPCVERVFQFAELPPVSQNAVLAQGAYTRHDDFRRVAWEAATRAHMEDGDLDFDRRHGDVLHAIEEAVDDPVLQPVAQQLYQENREAFEKLSGEPPEVTAAMSGVRPEITPATGTVHAAFLEGQNGDRCPCCGRTGGTRRYGLLQVWPGPVVIGIFPDIAENPVARSWQMAATEAANKRLNAQTLHALAVRAR